VLKITEHHSPTRDDMFIVNYSISMRCILGDKGAGWWFKGFPLLRSGSFGHDDGL